MALKLINKIMIYISFSLIVIMIILIGIRIYKNNTINIIVPLITDNNVEMVYFSVNEQTWGDYLYTGCKSIGTGIKSTVNYAVSSIGITFKSTGNVIYDTFYCITSIITGLTIASFTLSVIAHPADALSTLYHVIETLISYCLLVVGGYTIINGSPETISPNPTFLAVICAGVFGAVSGIASRMYDKYSTFHPNLPIVKEPEIITSLPSSQIADIVEVNNTLNIQQYLIFAIVTLILYILYLEYVNKIATKRENK